MKKNLLSILLLLVVGVVGYHHQSKKTENPSPSQATRNLSDDSIFRQAFETRARDLKVQGSGVVMKILEDDTDESPHQRFILQLKSGQTILIAHNIDLAPRIPSLSIGDAIEFSGEYEWNNKGGVVHWTHHDPSNQRQAGWLRHQHKTYQ